MSSSALSPDPPESTSSGIPPRSRRIAFAGFAGTFIEYYDFALYGVLTVYFAPLFFPADNEATSFLVGLGVFGAGFVARPVGGILFGRIGDRRGRRTALMATVTLMGMCSVAIAFLPTYESIGIIAPIMLVLLRIGQGLSAGAEMLGSVTYAIESAPRRQRALLSSLTPFGAGLGGASGAVLAAILALNVSADTMTEFGWRIPFLVAGPLTLLAFVLRRRIEDSPEFAKMVRDRQIVRSPLTETLRTHWRTVLVAGGIAIGVNGTAGVAQWFGVYLAADRGLPTATVLITYATSMIFGALWVPASGALTDRFGQRRMLTIVLTTFILAAVPVFWLLSGTEHPVLLVVGMGTYLMLTNIVMAPGFSFIAELFPPNIRYTAANVGQNIGSVLAGGTAPLICGTLLLVTGSPFGPTLWIVGVGLVGLGAVAAARRLTPAPTDSDDRTRSASEPTPGTDCARPQAAEQISNP